LKLERKDKKFKMGVRLGEPREIVKGFRVYFCDAGSGIECSLYALFLFSAFL
jgi:hypothetical protein